MEKALEGNKTLESLTLGDAEDATLPREFCCHILFGSRQNASLLELYLGFSPRTWDSPNEGMVHVCHMLCDSVGCTV